MKRALVTGANRGIGLELCRHLFQKGYEVYAVCRHTSDELSAVATHVIEGIDVGLDDAVEKLKAAVNVELDAVINCAGILRDHSLADLDFGAITEQFEVNSIGPLRVVKAVEDRLVRGGKIIMITSQLGSIGNNTSGGFFGYRMSKAALNMGSVSLAFGLKDRGIAVGIVHPGYVRTEMTGHQGNIEPSESAQGIIARMEALTLEMSGIFWHQNGEILPW